MKCDWDHQPDGSVVCKRCGFKYGKPVHKMCHLPGEQTSSPAPRTYGPKDLLLEIALTLPTDANYRTLDEIKTLLEAHCQPCDLFTGYGCQDFALQGSACQRRQRFIRRLMIRMFGCEQWEKGGLARLGPADSNEPSVV